LLELDVSRNQIKQIPVWVLTATAFVEIHSNPLDGVPTDVANGASQPIKSFLKEKAGVSK